MFGREGNTLLPTGFVQVLHSLYEVTARVSDEDMTAGDAHHRLQTPYLFRLWLDREWTMPGANTGRGRGAWFMTLVDAPAV